MVSQILKLDQGDPLWVEAQFNMGWLLFHRGALIEAKAAFEACEIFGEHATPEVKALVQEWLVDLRAKLGPDPERVQ